MKKSRSVVEHFGKRITRDGAGVKLSRVFGFHEIPQIDPFLLLDFFNSEDPRDYEKGFPWHPHRGIETVTYLIHGQIAHGDSLGNAGVISDGDCQWMTAGSGIIHQEIPLASPKMLGLQLWINLPKAHKMTEPAYRDILSATLPIVKRPFGEVRILCGAYEGVEGPVKAVYVKPTFLDVTLLSEKRFELDLEPDFNYFLVVIDGSGELEGGEQVMGVGEGYHLGREGDYLSLKAGEAGLRFCIFGGKPLDEPIAWGGPIVMNHKAELTLAFSQIEDGTFIQSL